MTFPTGASPQDTGIREQVESYVLIHGPVEKEEVVSDLGEVFDEKKVGEALQDLLNNDCVAEDGNSLTYQEDDTYV